MSPAPVPPSESIASAPARPGLASPKPNAEPRSDDAGSSPSPSSLAERRPALSERRRRERRPPSGLPRVNRIRDLSQRDRRLLFIGLLVAAVPAIVSAVSALHHSWFPTGDNALIGLRVSDVFTARTPIIGQPSTSDLYGSAAAYHPGPMEFWALALPYQLLGPAAGLVVGATLINLGAIVGVGLVACRRQGVLFALWSLTLVTVMSWGLGVDFLHDPISSNVATFSVVLLAFVVWSLVVGDLALLPLAAVVVSFVFQDHLSVLGQNAVLVLFAAAAVGWVIWRQRRALRGSDWRSYRATVVHHAGWALFAGVVLWAPVLVQQVTGHPGNLSAILQAYGNNTGHAHGAGWAVDRALTALGPRPIFLRQLDDQSLHYLDSPAGLMKAVALLPLAALVGLGLLARRRHRRHLVLLAVTAGVALVSGFYSAFTLPANKVGGAELKPSSVRWMWTAGMFVWLTIGWLVWSLTPPGVRRRASTLAGPVLAAVLVVASGLAVRTTDISHERDAVYFGPMAAVLPEVRAELKPGGRYVISSLGPEAGLTAGPAVAVDLAAHGHEVLAQQFFERAYGKVRTYDGTQRVDGAVYVVDESYRPPRHGARMVAVIAHPTPDVISSLGPSYQQVQRALAASGPPKVTSKGRDLLSGRIPVTTDIEGALHALLRHPQDLAITGLLAPAVQDGYVTVGAGLGMDVLDQLAQAVAGSAAVPYLGVFVGPPPVVDKPAG